MNFVASLFGEFNVKKLRVAWLYRGWRGFRRVRSEIGRINRAYSAGATKRDGGKALVFTSVPLFTDHVVTEYAIAHELKAQGLEVVLVYCDRALPVCHAHDRYSCGTPKSPESFSGSKVCSACSLNLKSIHEHSTLRIRTLSEVDRQRGADFSQFSEDAKAGVVRYLATSNADAGNLRAVTNLYESAVATAASCIETLIEQENPTLVVGHHGIYVPQGVVNKICRAKFIDYYSWHFGYRRSTLIFSKGNTYHKELGQQFPLRILGESELQEIKSYLASRWSGKDDWIHFNREPSSHGLEKTYAHRVVFYSSVDWDAALHFDRNVYDSQFDFVTDLIAVSREFPSTEFVIRVHPAESTGMHPSYSKLDQFIVQLEPGENVTVVPSTDKTSSYELAASADSAIVYNTKLGIELTSMGIPTIVAGESWVRGRGYTWDIDDREDLKRLISKVDALVMDEDMRARALSFAHYFYFGRCIHVPELKSISNKFHITYDATNEDKPGLPTVVAKMIAGDVVCAYEEG